MTMCTRTNDYSWNGCAFSKVLPGPGFHENNKTCFNTIWSHKWQSDRWFLIIGPSEQQPAKTGFRILTCRVSRRGNIIGPVRECLFVYLSVSAPKAELGVIPKTLQTKPSFHMTKKYLWSVFAHCGSSNVTYCMCHYQFHGWSPFQKPPANPYP